jgi:hypothetical protein
MRSGERDGAAGASQTGELPARRFDEVLDFCDDVGCRSQPRFGTMQRRDHLLGLGLHCFSAKGRLYGERVLLD